MTEKTKGLLTSMTIWGGGLVLLPELVEAINAIAASGVLPSKVASILHTVGALLAIFGRVRADKKISGLL